ncbi:MAG: hypothetical protein WC003_15920 [Terrimicrobiaceae bacterium]|jgi:hypothetical protein|nr:cell division protein ZapB [Terrimicrobiaceae bacterium]
MKYQIAILILCLCSACATRKAVKIQSSPAVAGVSRNDMPGVRVPETVKAYPAGRYTDPNFPDEMHERHTVYRREQSVDWNYRPSEPYSLPMGPTVAKSNPSPGYYVKADEEQRNAQQKAYAEALLEQNRAMKKRVEDLQREAAKVPELQQEVERLRASPNSLRRRLRVPPNPRTTMPSPPQSRRSRRGREFLTRAGLSSSLRTTMRARHSCFPRCSSTTSSPPNSNPWSGAGGNPFSQLRSSAASSSHFSQKTFYENHQTSQRHCHPR